MASGMEFYDSAGKLVYSSALFKLFRQAYVIEPTVKHVSVGSSGWIYAVTLEYTIPRGRGIVFFGYFGGYVRLNPSAESTFKFRFNGQSIGANGKPLNTTPAALAAKYKMNAHIMEF